MKDDVSFAEARKRTKASVRVTDKPYNVFASQPSTARNLNEQSTDLIETVVQRVLEKVLQIQQQQQQHPQLQRLENKIKQLLDQDLEIKTKRPRHEIEENMYTSLHHEDNRPNAPVKRRPKETTVLPVAPAPQGQREK